MTEIIEKKFKSKLLLTKEWLVKGLDKGRLQILKSISLKNLTCCTLLKFINYRKEAIYGRKKVILIMSDFKKSKFKNNVNNTEQWDSLGHLSVCLH